MVNRIAKEDITAVILAGGRSERMGGEDKGLVELWGKPLLAHVLDVVSTQVDSVIISANRNLQRYQNFGAPVIADKMGEHWGPLAGIATALQAIRTSYLLTLPCDTPCLPDDLIDRLCTALASESADLSVAHDGTRLQNTIVLLPRHLVDDLDAYLDSGQRKVETWLRQHKIAEVAYTDRDNPFLNVNSSEQLQALEAEQGCKRDLTN